MIRMPSVSTVRTFFLFFASSLAACGDDTDPGAGGDGGQGTTSSAVTSSTHASSSTGSSSTGSSSTGSSTGSGGICTPGETTACYDGPTGTLGVGICAGGTATCADDGSGFGACVGEVVPIAEDCSTTDDDDCDGSTACEWATTLGGLDDQFFYAAAARPTGGLVVVGSTEGDLVWSGGTSTSHLFADVLILAIDANGQVEWVQSFGSDGIDRAMGVAVSSTGEIAVTGQYQGPTSVGSTPLPFGGDTTAAFVATFEPDGTPIAARGFDGNDSVSAGAVDFDAAGNLVVTGSQRGTVDWGSGPLVSAESDVFVLRLHDDLSLDSVTLYGGPTDDYATSAVYPNGDLAMAGSYFSSIDLGDGPHVTAGDWDTFAALFDSSGNLSWSRSDGGPNWDQTNALITDPTGGLFYGGTFTGTIDFGGATSPVSGGFFVARVDASGTATRSTGFGPASYFGRLPGLARSSSGEIYVDRKSVV